MLQRNAQGWCLAIIRNRYWIYSANTKAVRVVYKHQIRVFSILIKNVIRLKYVVWLILDVNLSDGEEQQNGVKAWISGSSNHD